VTHYRQQLKKGWKRRVVKKNGDYLVMWLSAPESVYHSPDGGGVRDVVLNMMVKAF
jgi:hypothetical protein